MYMYIAITSSNSFGRRNFLWYMHNMDYMYVTCSQSDSRRLSKGCFVRVGVVAIRLLSRAREPQSCAFRVFTAVIVVVDV